MRQRLKPMLFDDEFLDEANASRISPVLKAVRSEHAKAKNASKCADDELPLHIRTLFNDLGTLTYNITHIGLDPEGQDPSSRTRPLSCSRRTRPVPSKPNLACKQMLWDQGLTSLRWSKFGLN